MYITISPSSDVFVVSICLLSRYILIIVVIIAFAIPNIIFQFAEIGDDGCITLENGKTECLEADNPLDEMLMDGKDKGLLYYNYLVAFGGVAVIAYKLFQV